MNRILIFLIFLLISSISFGQKDSLLLGSRYADDQVYASISYTQFFDQPSVITKSNFSYGVSIGFLKDFILNKKGSVSFALGIGYGYDVFNHELKVEESNNETVFSTDNTITSNIFKAHNLELPIELRWRTSTSNKYDFWRIYGGVKFIYNTSNSFQYIDVNNMDFKYLNVSAYNKLQYGLTLSAGYDKFNMNIFYGLTPIFNDANIEGEKIETKVIKFGLILYLL
ncbi:hypothetical protein BTO04_11800 [Polaribacter sp. SA4-10]|uniref:porin family protein n=1 Tax=Polaribacter sp. SA4-10 TaxID=754397 RepID=UPI000B3C55C0|nr:porin family protein [Polaribacter sp. SA4-10]ARV07330.1 hypothetical protein BTO04_11800 [Polaribacter sp. SA4-10]